MSTLDRLHPGLQQWVKEQGWPDLRPVQKAALDPVLSGESCVIEAPTAGGKTEAVLFPTLTRAAAAPTDSVQVLYLAPLRALLNNLELRGEDYARCCGLHAFKWHGDVAQAEKIKSFQQPPQLLLTTPESVEAILLRKPQWRKFFAGLHAIIIDEAHNFAANDRGGHLLALLERLSAGTSHEPQRIALSATVGNPEAMCDWLTGDRKSARRVHVEAGEAKATDYVVKHFDDTGETEDTPYVERAAFRLLDTMATELTGNRGIVFVRSRTKAEEMAKALQQFTRDKLRLRTHHSAVSKFFREEAEDLIQLAGEQGIESIISTSTLELGVDIGELDRILQLGGLSSPSAFLQRVGRTGRRPGKPRHFRGLTQDIDELLLLTATVSLGLEHTSDSLRLPTCSFHLLAHQLLCLSLQENGVTPRFAWDVLSRSHAFSKIGHEEFSGLVEHMRQEDFLRVADGVLVPGEEAERRFLTAGWRQLFAVFNTAPLYDVLEGRNQVGTLDIAFVEGLEVPFHFTLAGRLWKAHDIDYESKTIQASRATEGVAPKWDSFGGPDVPFETAQRVGEMLHGHRELPSVLDKSAEAVLEAMRMLDPDETSWQPGTIDIVAESSVQIQLRTYAGDRINRTLARLLEAEGFKTRGNYAGVTVGSSKDTQGEDLLARTRQALRQLLQDASRPEHLEARLFAGQSAWQFSPFAAMLPETIQRATLVDATTEPAAVLRLIERTLS